MPVGVGVSLGTGVWVGVAVGGTGVRVMVTVAVGVGVGVGSRMTIWNFFSVYPPVVLCMYIFKVTCPDGIVDRSQVMIFPFDFTGV